MPRAGVTRGWQCASLPARQWRCTSQTSTTHAAGEWVRPTASSPAARCQCLGCSPWTSCSARRAEPFERLGLDAVLVVAHQIKPEVRVWVCLVVLAEHPQCCPMIFAHPRVRDEAAGWGNRGPATREGMLFHHIIFGAALGAGGWLDESLAQLPGGCIH